MSCWVDHFSRGLSDGSFEVTAFPSSSEPGHFASACYRRIEDNGNEKAAG